MAVDSPLRCAQPARRASSSAGKRDSTAGAAGGDWCSCWHYTRLAGSLVQNLLNRLGSEAMDALSAGAERVRAAARRAFRSYDDVLPTDEDLEKNAPTPELGGKKLPLPVSPTSNLGGQLPQRPLPPPPESTKPPFRQPPAAPTSPAAAPAPHRHKRAPPAPGNLQSEPWFHDVDRRRALESLRASGKDGCFMVRPSSLTSNPLTLTLLFQGRVYNISLRLRPDGLYALGTEKRNEKVFSNVEELIENYRTEKLVLYSNGEKTGRTVLTATPDRPRPRARPYEPS